MEAKELVKLMKEVEEKKMAWEEVEKEIGVSYELLKLYANSGPVPVTILKNLKNLLEKRG